MHETAHRQALFAKTILSLTLLSAGCHGGSPSQGTGSQAPSATGAAAAAVPADAGSCLQPDIVAPFKHYSDDMIRGLATDGHDVYFRTLSQTFRVPLAGGEPAVIGKSPPGMGGPLWVLGEELVSQPTGQPSFVAMPKSGGAWAVLGDATSDKSGGAEALPTIFHNVGRGRVEAAKPALLDGSVFYFIEEDGVSSGGFLGKLKKTWSIRRMPASGGKPQTLYTSERELVELIKVGDTLFFQRDETPEKPAQATAAKKSASAGAKATETHAPARAKIPGFEPHTWRLVAMPASGGKPVARVASVSSFKGTPMATDGVAIYYTVNSGSLESPSMTLFRLAEAAAAQPERAGDWVIEVLFGAPYGADGFAFVVKAAEQVMARGVPSGFAPFLYTGSRSHGAITRRECLANRVPTDAYALTGNTLVFAAEMADGTGSQGVVKLTLP